MSDFNRRIGGHTPTLSFWMASLVEDMLQEARTGLLKQCVIGPGRAILFYARHSVEECLKVDEARDAAFLLTGAGTWVGKAAYLTTDPVTFQEGKKVIAQAVSNNRIKARGPGCPCANLPAQQLFQFNAHRTLVRWDQLRRSMDWATVVMAMVVEGIRCGGRTTVALITHQA